MYWFKLADVEAKTRKNNYIIVILDEKINAGQLTPELRSYQKLRLCIQAKFKPEDQEDAFDAYNEDTEKGKLDKLIARIR